MDQIKDERMKKMLAELAELREYDKIYFHCKYS